MWSGTFQSLNSPTEKFLKCTARSVKKIQGPHSYVPSPSSEFCSFCFCWITWQRIIYILQSAATDFNRRPKHLLQAVLCIIVGALQLPVQLLHLRPRLYCGRQSLEKVILMEGQRTCCHHPILAILHFKIMIVYDEKPCERAPRSYRKRGWARSPQYEGSHRFSR